ncbi:peptidase T [candidate division KSB1 bacterium]|nr:peptidase T [candidate division KSB1 bacterium]
MIEKYTCTDRFLKYVTFDTQSSESSDSYPTTSKQKNLGRFIVKELLALGLEDAAMDEWGYVTATLAANISYRVPVIGLIAHLDTSPDVSGANVKAILHKNYQGEDIHLPSGITISVDENPKLKQQIGSDIFTSDGSTLLGADNKAGIAEIMDAISYLIQHPEIPHGTIKIAFTPDEEVGRGTEHFDVKKFGADYAYTIDGESAGEVEDETFCADSVNMTISGVNVHPGYAKNKLVNAIKIAAAVIEQLPKQNMSPETTEKRQGYIHPHYISGSVETAVIKYLIRDFTIEGLHEKEEVLKKTAQKVLANFPKASLDFEIVEYYRNMKYELDKDPKVVQYALEAVKRTGLTAVKNIIRGGTDGAKLSYAGLLTPNIFTGGHNFHSRQEWISVQDMQKAVDVIIHLVQIWCEKSKGVK